MTQSAWQYWLAQGHGTPCQCTHGKTKCFRARQIYMQARIACRMPAAELGTHVMNDMDMRRDSMSAASNTFLASRLCGSGQTEVRH